MKLVIQMAFFMMLFNGLSLTYADNMADNGLVVKSSNFSVSETLDRFSTIIKKKGITLFARINHAQGANKVGLSMPDTEVLIFGNPKLGTPLMLSQRTTAIDLPLKVIAWQDEKGKVWLAYNKPDYIATRHGITNQQAIINKITGALNAFSTFATQLDSK
jgi:uncharacterized protein (DUF302 family)